MLSAFVAQPVPPAVVHPPPGNRLLAALPPGDLDQLRPHLCAVELPIRATLISPGVPIEAVHFPLGGWVSMVATLADGDCAEVGLVGGEGMIGLPLLLGVDTGTVQALVQGSGTALRLEARVLRQFLGDSPALSEVLLRYVLAFQEQVTQTAACNGHHTLKQRLARWLLMTGDRAGADQFSMTQDFLAMMLCVHRPGITVAARLLQRTGLIRYAQGRMTITDRAGLGHAACECYDSGRRRFDLLFPPPS